MYSAAIEAAGDTRSLELDETGATDSYQLAMRVLGTEPMSSARAAGLEEEVI